MMYDLNPYMDIIEMHDSLRELIFDEMEDSNRFYHTTKHIYLMMGKLDLYDRGREKIYACLMHDFIYDVRRKDNEERSAMVAYAYGKHFTCLDDDQIDFACSLIRCTSTHADHIYSSDKAVRDFILADLSIFYEPWETYEWYMQGVRKEYAHIPDDIYVPARIQILKEFQTHFRDAENIDKEIRLLLQNQ